MILRELRLYNFGLFAGDHSFNLAPTPVGGFDRPIVLVTGKNGVGKTSLVEAIRLCLHGPLALGSRVRRSEYNDYLLSRIHRPLLGAQPSKARIELLFDYVRSGTKLNYHVIRSWYRSGEKVIEDLRVLESDDPPANLAADQYESFLRELVPPGLTELFFFDSEKLEILSQERSYRTLASTINSMLGLNMVEQLQKDLDLYISRHTLENNQVSLQQQLEQVVERIAALEHERDLVVDAQRINNEERSYLQHAINEQQQKIASEGNWFASQRDDLSEAQQRLRGEIESQRHRVQELCSGLLPFALAPQMCRHVAERLRLELEYERWVLSKEILDNQYNQLLSELSTSDFWSDLELVAKEETKQHLIARVSRVLERTRPVMDVSPNEVILNVSDQERRILFNWIDQALSDCPKHFYAMVVRLRELEDELADTEHKLRLVPPDEVLKPLVDALGDLNQRLGVLKKKGADLDEQLRGLNYGIEQAHYRLRSIRQQVLDQESGNLGIQLAGKAAFILDEYATELTAQKAAVLATRFTDRFNQLCRKDTLIDGVEIDPATFEIQLVRSGHKFDRSELSAGENQILAVAMMWALKDVSGRPMPVIIDTPLGRLDSDHRRSMVHEYFPKVSHQVVLLAADTEIDSQVVRELAPAISHTYNLQYNHENGSTSVLRINFAQTTLPRQKEMILK